jgi:hypothetical protein
MVSALISATPITLRTCSITLILWRLAEFPRLVATGSIIHSIG